MLKYILSFILNSTSFEMLFYFTHVAYLNMAHLQNILWVLKRNKVFEMIEFLAEMQHLI